MEDSIGVENVPMRPAKFTPKSKTKISSHKFCDVCGKSSGYNRDLIFHAIPKAGGVNIKVTLSDGKVVLKDRRQVWFDVTGIDPASRAPNVCSSHFHRADYFVPDTHGVKKRSLKKCAIPSLDLPKSPEKGVTHFRQQRKFQNQVNREKARSILHQNYRPRTTPSSAEGQAPESSVQDGGGNVLMEMSPNIPTTTIMEGTSHTVSDLITPVTKILPSEADSSTNRVPSVGLPDVADEVVEVTQLQDINEELQEINSAAPTKPPPQRPVTTCSVACQTEISGDILPVKYKFADTLDNDKKVRAFTGLSGVKFLMTLVNILQLLKPDTEKCYLKAKDRIVLTYMKLKLNVSFVALAMIFNISSVHAKRIFHDTLYRLKEVTHGAVYWPTKEEIMRNIPASFRKFGFSNVRVVLDATEVKTTKTKCILCRCKAYSHYKGHHTIKFLLGVSPAGLITFVSKAFGGRASDKCMFVDSGLINKLEPHIDSVMVDKGVLIKDICADHNISLIHPEFLRKPYTQFNKQQSKKNFEVSNCRVHVERAIGRMKIFKILRDGIPWRFASYATAIFRLIAATVNLSNPILANDKFFSHDTETAKNRNAHDSDNDMEMDFLSDTEDVAECTVNNLDNDFDLQNVSDDEFDDIEVLNVSFS